MHTSPKKQNTLHHLLNLVKFKNKVTALTPFALQMEVWVNLMWLVVVRYLWARYDIILLWYCPCGRLVSLCSIDPSAIHRLLTYYILILLVCHQSSKPRPIWQENSTETRAKTSRNVFPLRKTNMSFLRTFSVRLLPNPFNYVWYY